jgi:hypothetical protein
LFEASRGQVLQVFYDVRQHWPGNPEPQETNKQKQTNKQTKKQRNKQTNKQTNKAARGNKGGKGGKGGKGKLITRSGRQRGSSALHSGRKCQVRFSAHLLHRIIFVPSAL